MFVSKLSIFYDNLDKIWNMTEKPLKEIKIPALFCGRLFLLPTYENKTDRREFARIIEAISKKAFPSSL